MLAEEAAVEVPWPADLSIVAFRPAGAGPDDLGPGRALLERINGSGRVFVSSTMIDDRFTLRLAILSFRTHADRIDEAIELIGRAAKAG